MVKMYSPVETLAMFESLELNPPEENHEKEYGGIAPETSMNILPSEAPLQENRYYCRYNIYSIRFRYK
jgi:hypothetical protein